MDSHKVRIAVIGLHFGAAFVPIYQAHPDVDQVALCDLNVERLNAVGERFGITARFTRLEDILASDTYDAVHLATPVPFHVEPTLAVLAAGKHCACAVPMATDMEGLQQIIHAQQRSGTNYMMMETAIFQLARDDLAAEVTRSWFQTARAYAESFSVYGDKRGFEWQLEHEDPLLFTLEPVQPAHRGRPVTATRVTVPDRPELLPNAIARFTQGGHGGAHPHLAHEFVRSIVERRPPAIDVFTSAEWTLPGICAHESALRDGEPVVIPDMRI
jgi:predicted dehydrogenase